eukprot:CAMPEP_0114242626 /NCGR_PEP_ID=MMETSP0058-20121206/10281_1 /TAXON_ID=36894 /ORGANISM="Pyramimonas parkeae, CCMP726" /LENGTH=55 /DNA_ID=CAMNT_0001355261 /DNA_START=821 /DNA_END=988 /DNA_ORIENTATION=+
MARPAPAHKYALVSNLGTTKQTWHHSISVVDRINQKKHHHGTTKNSWSKSPVGSS